MSIEERLGCPATTLPAVLLKNHALVLLTIGTFAGARRITDLTKAMRVSFVAGALWRAFCNLDSPARRARCRDEYATVAKAEWKRYVDLATLAAFFAGYLLLRFFPFDFEVISRITTRTIGLVSGYRLSGMLLPAMIVWGDPKADREEYGRWVGERDRQPVYAPPEAQHTLNVLNGARNLLGAEFQNGLDMSGNFHKLVDHLAEGLEVNLGSSSDEVDSRVDAVKAVIDYKNEKNRKLAELILQFEPFSM